MQVAAEVFLIVSLLMVFAPELCSGAFFCVDYSPLSRRCHPACYYFCLQPDGVLYNQNNQKIIY